MPGQVPNTPPAGASPAGAAAPRRDDREDLVAERIAVVLEMTELNARVLAEEGLRAGIAVELLPYAEADADPDGPPRRGPWASAADAPADDPGARSRAALEAAYEASARRTAEAVRRRDGLARALAALDARLTHGTPGAMP